MISKLHFQTRLIRVLFGTGDGRCIHPNHSTPVRSWRRKMNFPGSNISSVSKGSERRTVEDRGDVCRASIGVSSVLEGIRGERAVEGGGTKMHEHESIANWVNLILVGGDSRFKPGSLPLKGRRTVGNASILGPSCRCRPNRIKLGPGTRYRFSMELSHCSEHCV